MQAYIKENLLQELIKIQELTNIYLKDNSQFVAKTIQWMKNLEEILAKTRNPLVSKVSIQRNKLLSALEGNVTLEGVSKRKIAKFQAIKSLEHIEHSIRILLDDLDNKFEDKKDKIAQLIAISSSKSPIKLIKPQLDNDVLKDIWGQLGSAPEAINMYHYISSSIPNSDLMYLLNEVMSNMLQNTTKS